ncbi:hypothetical protein FSARC_13228 [Fusarium sarcochroum]|uniref:Uncharacterized protein n=1 Tax=Fusarium sarcochroum TaxID=1208366 RepID=A0A8H4T306_9HYPO|nr:hypothetical protein FSARC_13228 [Fusarium sarcochroum]
MATPPIQTVLGNQADPAAHFYIFSNPVTFSSLGDSEMRLAERYDMISAKRGKGGRTQLLIDQAHCLSFVV